jgi:Bacterial Ig domain
MRGSSIAGAGALLLLAVVTMGQAQDTCRVDLGRGWSTGGGQGRIVMKNTSAGCGATLAADPDAAILVDDIQLIVRPQHGVVAVVPPRFKYTPDTGFTGTDTFSLSARGRNRDGRPVELRGTVTVEVR